MALWRDRLALAAPGNYAAMARPVSVAHQANALQGIGAEQIALCLDATGLTPVDRAAHVIEAVLTDTPRSEAAALILADVVLARALEATHALPLVLSQTFDFLSAHDMSAL